MGLFNVEWGIGNVEWREFCRAKSDCIDVDYKEQKANNYNELNESFSAPLCKGSCFWTLAFLSVQKLRGCNVRSTLFALQTVNPPVCSADSPCFQWNKSLRICEIRLTASEIAVGSEMSADEGGFIPYVSLLIAHC